MNFDSGWQWIRRYWWLPPVCFYAMEVLHEAGHMIAGMLTGARIEAVELLPWQLSRTGFSVNPHPGIVVWGGPVGGILLVLLLWGVFRRWRYSYLFRFFAGFSLVANGLYIGLGGFGRVGDCFEMLKIGTSLWSMVLFGIAATVAGFFVWHMRVEK